MPGPAEYVTIRRIRVTPSIENIWWLSPTPNPKADNRNVLVDYSSSMRKTLTRGTNAGTRPSGHAVGHDAFRSDNGGAIPHSLIVAANTASNTSYLRRCREAGIHPHPARFPEALPEFAIRLTTDRDDVVLDPLEGVAPQQQSLSASAAVSSSPIAVATISTVASFNSPLETAAAIYGQYIDFYDV
jgi:site-specific DNA-methyltransferase (cytosine-N4-specific)